MSNEDRRAARCRNQNMNRRIRTLLIRAHELYRDYGVDVAIVLKKDRYRTYRTSDGPTWPPSMAAIVRCPLITFYTTNLSSGRDIPRAYGALSE
jgi:hypothetical protein